MTHAPLSQIPKLLPVQAYAPLLGHEAPETGQVELGAVDEVAVEEVLEVLVALVVDFAVALVVVELDEGGMDPPQGAPVRRIFLASWA